MAKTYTCFSRYLAAKKTIDDRSLNRHVLDALRAALSKEHLRVLEVGCGIGTMVERLVDWEVLSCSTIPCKSIEYHAIDSEPTNITVLNHRLKKRDLGDVTVKAETRDIFDVVKSSETYDLLIAHAVLDLLPLPNALDQLLALLKPNGLAYLTLNFDGITHFEPPHPTINADQLAALYHANMDTRITNGVSSGDSQTGRHLFTYLQNHNILAAGSSDWVVHPQNGGYLHDEAYFLHFIIDTVTNALSDQVNLADWQTTRHAQIEAGTLTYIAHQIDFLVQVEQE